MQKYLTLINVIFILYVVLQLYDAYSTIKSISTNNAHEDNEKVAYIIKKIGLIPALILKTTFVLLVGIYFLYIKAVILLSLITLFYCYYMYNNYKVLSASLKKQ